MAAPNARKLNQLERDLPEGMIVDAAWLTRRGYSTSLRSHYVKSGWLQQPTRGVYRRPYGELDWQLTVLSIQMLLRIPLVIGGRTAIELQGRGHYARSIREVHLYGPEPPPAWLNKLEVGVAFRFHNSGKLFDNAPITRALTHVDLDLRSRKVKPADPVHGGLTTHPLGHWQWPLTLSTLERAFLELLDELPDHETFHQADVIMEGLSDLSPRRLQKLLEDCRSIKVKRLFFFFASRHGHAWLKRLDRSRIDLGRGKRQLVKGGRFDAAHGITVPESF